MADNADSEVINLYQPKKRFIIPINNFHVPKKLFKLFKRNTYTFKINNFTFGVLRHWKKAFFIKI